MFFLTPQERKVLFFVGILILTGSVLKLAGFKNSLDSKDFSSSEISVIQAQPIDINKAFQEELESIPGIGPTIAGRIIDYRNQFGTFRIPNDLKAVKGIGDKKIEIIKKYIVVN